MEKFLITNNLIKDKEILGGQKGLTCVYKINEEEVLKVYSDNMIYFCLTCNSPLEDIIKNANSKSNSIVIPNKIGYLKKKNGKYVFQGCISKYVRGKTDFEYFAKLSKKEQLNLFKYAEFYLKLEKIIKMEDKKVFPDLCSKGNIMVDENDEIKLIDYDGIQSEPFTSAFVSSYYKTDIIYEKKYCDTNKFTKELDIKSLIDYYFEKITGINLNYVGTQNPFTRKTITLDVLFKRIGINDYDIMHKIWKTISLKERNEYLGEDVYKIAENYKLVYTDVLKKRKLVRR